MRRCRYRLDLADAGWRCDVNFGHITANHIDADKDKAIAFKGRGDAFADFNFALGQIRVLSDTANMHVGTHITFRRDAVNRTDRFAINKDDAFVALTHIIQIKLQNPDGVASPSPV